MKFGKWLIALVLGFASLQAAAQRQPVPIVNHESILVERPGGKAATADQVKQAIVAAAGAGARKWTVSEPQPGVLVATYHVRTHTVTTEIRYSATTFSVKYRDSINMKYKAGEGAGLIHPFYNQWVQEFVHAVRQELARS